MKIPAQEKIAELESRIAQLEATCEKHFGVYFYKTGCAPPIVKVPERNDWLAKLADVFFNGRSA